MIKFFLYISESLSMIYQQQGGAQERVKSTAVTFAIKLHVSVREYKLKKKH